MDTLSDGAASAAPAERVARLLVRQEVAALVTFEQNSAGCKIQVAETCGSFGDVDRAFAWLDEAVLKGDPGIQWLRGDPFLRTLTGDPRYRELMRRLKMRM